jgi:hypothetical protein
MIRLFLKRARAFVLILGVVEIFSRASGAETFVHPGLLQSREDLARMKIAVTAKTEPFFSGYEVFRASAQSQLNYKMRGPLAMVGRNPTVGQNVYDSDANAAYQCAVMWGLTGDIAYANKSKEIINAWSSTLKSITGRDAVLMAGLGPFKMVNAAEILRYTDAGWSPAEIQQTEKHFREVIYPVIKDFAPFANGNWDTAAIKTMMAIGVFCNDRAIFERALRYCVNGAGDGRLTHYIINETGQCQESGRDQQHTQLGLAHLGDCCEIAWHQGLDLYGYDDNRLLKGFEYTAKYNLGEEVPFAETLDRTGKYHHTLISNNGRGRFRAVFEEIYNHYANRVEISAPFTQRAAERIRPEGSGGLGADHVGFGTLLFTRPVSSAASTRTETAPASPAAVIAEGSPNENKLTWIAPVNAKNYTVKRATKNDDYKIIARDISVTTYTDTKVKSGEIYRYVISASNSSGESPNSYSTSICAGLPKPWTHQDIGTVSVPGSANFDGNIFTLEGAGAEIGGTNDQFQFAFVPFNGDCTIVARFVPQTSSQFSKFGLMMREAPAADAANATLLILPEAGRNIEAPGWQAQLTVHESTGAASIVRAASEKFSEPTVTFGRLTGYCWLKLERAGDSFIASISSDGKTWAQVGSATVALKRKLFVGLPVCSRLAGITTTAMFDHVTVTNSVPKINSPAENQIESPDGKVAVNFFLQAGGVPAYTIGYLGKPIVLESRLGLLPDFTNGFEIGEISQNEHQGKWSQVYGERKIVPDNYRELNVDLKQASGCLMRITFRAYNEGAAFRYSFPKQKTREFHFTGEQSEFHFPENTFGYEEHGTEGEYQRAKISDIEPWCERPLTLEYASGLFACLGEADNENYPRMLLSSLPGVPGALVSALGGMTSNTDRFRQRHDPTAKLAPPARSNPLRLGEAGDSTPWRMFVVGEKPGDLLERNYLMLNLNPPLALKNVSWIKPGKVMRDTTITTANSKAIIDFAAKAGLQYVHLDWKWYGSEDAEIGDATTVRVPNLDIPEIIRYGREKNVGLILYVDRRQIKKQRDILFPLYEKWGVKGVKIGFVDVGPQTETVWITETIKKAAEHHLMLNIHDGYRPTGFARTYPNLLTVEGVRGNEHFPTPEHNCTLPFTRYVAGSADYTVCYYDQRLQTTHAHQLAMAVVSYSPLQWIFWYDRPSMFGGEPEIEFFQHVPTVWDDTKVINGEIGKFATIARRSGDDWFIGTINNREPRELKVSLAFLDGGKKYTAHLYSDDQSVATRTKVGIETRAVDSRTILNVPLRAAGGHAVWITPAK